MKKKIVIAIVGATVGILAGLLVFINIPKNGEEVPAIDEVVSDSPISKSGNTILDDEQTLVEFETDNDYTEDSVEVYTGNASDDTALDENDISYVSSKNEILDSTQERAYSNMYAATDTSVYAERSVESEVIGSVKMNDVLKSYGCVDGWYVIDYDGRDGFVPAQFISPAKVTDSEQAIALNEQNGMTTNPTETNDNSDTGSTSSNSGSGSSSTGGNSSGSSSVVDEDTNSGAFREEEVETAPASTGTDKNTMTAEEQAEFDALMNELINSGTVSVNDNYTGYETTVEPEPEPEMTPERKAYLDSLDWEIHCY